MKKSKFYFLATLVLFVFSFYPIRGLEVKAADDGKCGVNVFAPGNYHPVEGDKKSSCVKMKNNKVIDNTTSSADYIKEFVKKLAWISTGVGALVIVYAGFAYTLSDGDPKKIERAKQLIIMSAMGMFIALFAIVVSDVIMSGLSDSNLNEAFEKKK